MKHLPLISDQVTGQEINIIIRYLKQAVSSSSYGDIVELGCYNGTTSLFIQQYLTQNNLPRKFHVYDSFEGLPAKLPFDNSPAGEQFIKGELKASRQIFIKNFRRHSLPLPVIHKGWFEALNATDLPEQIAFAFLDGDYYSSIHYSLKLIENKLVKGSVIIIDDYQSEALPGARKAVDEWLSKCNYSLRVEASLAIISV
jgi:O-methyltransferase